MAKDKDKKRTKNGGGNAALFNALAAVAGGIGGAVAAGVAVQKGWLTPNVAGLTVGGLGVSAALFSKGKVRWAGAGMGATAAGQLTLGYLNDRERAKAMAAGQQPQQQRQQQARNAADVESAFRYARENMERNAEGYDLDEIRNSPEYVEQN